MMKEMKGAVNSLMCRSQTMQMISNLYALLLDTSQSLLGRRKNQSTAGSQDWNVVVAVSSINLSYASEMLK